jgi:hypothetical protein
MSYRPTSNFKRWTSEEDTILREMIANGKNSAQIARTLGRTRVSIFARKAKLGINGKMAPARGSQMPYTHGTKTRNGNHKGRVKGTFKAPTPVAPTHKPIQPKPIQPSRATLGAHLDALMASAKAAGVKMNISFTTEDTKDWL